MKESRCLQGLVQAAWAAKVDPKSSQRDPKPYNITLKAPVQDLGLGSWVWGFGFLRSAFDARRLENPSTPKHIPKTLATSDPSNELGLALPPLLP